MANIAFRDSSIVVIDTGRTTLRAGLGLHDLLQRPSVEISARVGVRRSAYTNGESASDASGSASAPPPGVKVTDYIVGEQLDEALAAGQDLAIFWPFANGGVSDWIQAEALWKHILFTRLHLRRLQNESPVLLTLFPGLSRDTYEQAAQTFFERFNVAGFAILDRASAQLYAASYLTGIVIDISDRYTDVNIILDGAPFHQARVSLPIGVEDCEQYLAQLLRQNTSVTTALSLAAAEAGADAEVDAALLELARQVWRDGLVRPAPGLGDVFEPEDGVTDIAAIVVAGKEKAVVESAAKRRANAKATAAELARAKEIEALDLVTITFRGKEVTLGKERHRFCDPLFHPTLVKDMPHRQGRKGRTEKIMGALQDVVAHAVSIADVDQRQYIYGGLLVTGEVTGTVKGLGFVLQSRLAPFILGNPDQQNDVQTKAIRVLKVPDYFGEYRETGEGYAAFLGASIVGKISFNDPLNKNFLSKADYSVRGPHAILEMSPSLL